MPYAVQALRSVAELGCALTGLFFCVATSSPEEPPDIPPAEPLGGTDGELEPTFFDARVHIHNGTAQAQTIRLRSLASEVSLDCPAVLADPGRLLTTPLFGPVESWTLEAGANMPIDTLIDDNSGCRVAIVSIDGMADALLSWQSGAFAPRPIPGDGPTGGVGEVVLRPLDGGGVELTDAEASLVHALVGSDDPEPACAIAGSGERLTWAEPVPAGEVELVAVREGLDGCLELEFDAASAWFLCVPLDVFPFEAGDAVSIVETWAGGGRGVEVASQRDDRSLYVGSGGANEDLQSMTWEPAPGCAPDVELGCGTAATGGTVWLGDPQDHDRVEIRPGHWVEQVQGDHVVRTYVAVAQSVLAVRAECAQGVDAIGVDVSMARAVFEDTQEVE